MDSEERKLIDEIRDGLHNFEIPYGEGNWENFQRSHRDQLDGSLQRSRPLRHTVWKYAGAAAILIGVLIYMSHYLVEKQNVRLDQNAEQQNPPLNGQMHVTADSPESDVNSIPSNKKRVSEIYKHMAGISDIRRKAEGPLPQPQTGIQYRLIDEIPLLTRTPVENEKEQLTFKKKPLVHFDRTQERTPTASRWEFGIEVNSSFISDRVNFGTGILTQFEVSEKVKLSTGVAYSSISATHDVNPVQIAYDTKMTGGKSVIKAIDIPLSIIYEPTDGWYASVGVSALAVIAENKVYRLASEILMEHTSTDPESGAVVSVFEVVKNEYWEQSTNIDFKGRSDLSYLNLSIGKKQRFNRGTALLFEPFVKIPMGGLRRGDANLLNSGVKIKVLF